MQFLNKNLPHKREEEIDLTPFIIQARRGLRRDVQALLEALPKGLFFIPLAKRLNDGRRIERVAIIGNIIGDIFGMDHIPFKEEDIVNIIVSHDKWDFETGREIGELPHP